MIFVALVSYALIFSLSAIRAPAVVYSAVIENDQGKPIDCKVIWSNPSNQLLQSPLFTIEHQKYHLVNEKTIPMDTWEARATIEEIRCNDLSLKAPFAKVVSPTTHWTFRVQSDKIISVGPSSHLSSQ